MEADAKKYNFSRDFDGKAMIIIIISDSTPLDSWNYTIYYYKPYIHTVARK